MPCNLNQRELAQHVKRGIRAAGGTPMEFNTISVSDGVSMGTEGMRASLVSREVIADSIELVARGHLFDGLVCLVGCDKTIPAAVMALARLDLPGLVLYNGSIAPGRFRGRDVTIQDVFEAVGAHAVGKMSGAERARARGASPAPGRGPAAASSRRTRCRRRSTSSGSAPPGLNGIPALDPAKHEAAAEAGRLAMASSRRRRPPVADRSRARRSRTPHRLDRGDRRLDERRAAPARDRPRARHPLRRSRTSTHRGPDAGRREPQARRAASWPPTSRGGRGRARRPGAAEARARPRRRAERRRPLARRDRRGRRRSSPGQEVVVPIETPLKATGGLAILLRQPRARGLRREARRPRAAAPPRPGARLRLRGGLLRGRQGNGASRRATSSSSATRGPPAGPGMREMLHVTAAHRRRGPGRLGRARHRRALLRRDARAHGRPRRARGRPRRAARRAAGRRHRRGRRRGPRAAGRARRRRARRPPRRLGSRRRRATRSGVFAKYAAEVSSASEGAITRPPGS